MSEPLRRRDFMKLLALCSSLRLDQVLRPISHRSTRNQTGPVRIRDPGAPSSDERPNILILVFDALSARNMSLYGYPRETTPNIADFGKRSMVYRRHSSPANFTLPGVASLLTGAYPWSHRALHLRGTVAGAWRRRNLFRLAEDAGYHRFAYTQNNYASYVLNSMAQDIDEYPPRGAAGRMDRAFLGRLLSSDSNVADWAEDLLMREYALPTSTIFAILDRFIRRITVSEALLQRYPRGIPDHNRFTFLLEDTIDWLVASLREMPTPFLAYIHLLPPHHPYTARRDFIDKFLNARAPEEKPDHPLSPGVEGEDLNLKRREYDEYVAFVDHEFGRLISNLSRLQLLDNTMLVLTSDHGEMFERGILGHTTPTLFEPIVHIPLLISLPRNAPPEEIHAPTSAIDLMPSILALMGLPIPTWSQGRRLPGLGGEAKSRRSIFSVEAKQNPKWESLQKVTVAMREGEYKLIHYLGYEEYDRTFEMFDLETDPEERRDVYEEGWSVAKKMQAQLLDRLNHENRRME